MRPSGELGLIQGGVGSPESFMNRAGWCWSDGKGKRGSGG